MSTKTKILVQKLMDVSEKIKKQICQPSEMANSLTLGQFQTLQILSNGQKLTMAEIADQLGIRPASATAVVNKMVEQGWLVRENDASDRRKIWIRIAEEKKSAWNQQEEEQLRRLREFMDVLSEEQKEKFIDILDILLKR